MTVLRSDRSVIQENAVHRNWQWSSVSKVEGRIRHPCDYYPDTSLNPILKEHNVNRVPPTVREVLTDDEVLCLDLDP